MSKSRFEASGVGHTVQTATTLSALPLQPLNFNSPFRQGKPMDAWSQQVDAGDNLAVSVQETNGLKDRTRIKILDPSGHVVGRTSFSRSPNLFLQAETSGTYTIVVVNKNPNVRERDAVSLEVFGLNKGTPLPSAEADTGKRVAWLDGNVLTLSDPSGEGFAITSNWSESVRTDPATGMPYAIYTTNGPSRIDLGASSNLPEVQGLSIGLTGTITIQTDPGLWGAHAGTVASADFGDATSPSAVNAAPGDTGANTIRALALPPQSSAPTSLDANALFAEFNDEYGLGITLPGDGFGMKTGQQLMAMAGFSDVPLRPDGTYFYAQKNTGGSVSFGNVTASASNSQTITVVLDPSDPFVYVAGGPIAFGASLKGMIPFVPESSSYTGPTFSGHFYGKVSDLKLGTLPASASGMAVINVDPNKKSSDAAAKYGSATSTVFSQSWINSNLGGIDIGVNGTVTAETEVGGVGLSVDVGHATAAFVAAGFDPVLTVKRDWSGNIFVPRTKSYDQRFDTTFVFAPFRGIIGDVPNSRLYDVSMVARPNYFGVAGNTTDPFEGTALEGYFKAGPSFTAELSASGNSLSDMVRNVTADFHGSADWGGYHFGTVDFTGNKDRISFSAPMHVFIGQAQVTGDVNLRTGAFLASATFAGASTDSILPGSTNLVSRSLTVSLQNTPRANGVPSISFYADVSLGFRASQNFSIPAWYILGYLITPAVDLGEYGVYGSLAGRIFIDPSNSNYSGNLSASGGFIIASQNAGGSLGVGFSNNVITIGTSLYIPFYGQRDFGFSYTL
ncbi:hypothetical protein ACYOEI_04615 [Singulisphaera rosea]